MRTVLTITALLFCSIASGQNCFCARDSILSQIISCDTLNFDNQARLYWNFNCDSSWLTFESPTHKKELIFSLGGGFIAYTGRLGLIYATEYKHTFLMQDNVISGCCDPPEFFLYDKATGQEKESLGRILFYSDNRDLPIIISITGSGYDSTSAKSYNSLTVYNVDQQRQYIIKLPKGELNKILEQTETAYPEQLFDTPVIKGDILELSYLAGKPAACENRKIRIITIDLKQYRQ